jgi:hypothetical protein
VKEVHLAVGILSIVLMAAVAVYAAWAWSHSHPRVWFWRLLRVAQLVLIVQVALGGVLLLTGKKPGHLHVLYGVLPLLVSLIAEALRAASAQTVLDARGYESPQAVGEQSREEQQAVVLAILRREFGLIALAALVIVVLLLRAAQTA